MSGWDLEVSIATDNNCEGLRLCLESIPESARDVRVHVNVVDNATTDGTRGMLAEHFPAVGVIANRSRRGFGANHNGVLGRVVASRSARYVLVLNDDTKLEAGSLDRLVEAMDLRPSVGAMVPSVYDEEGRLAASRLAYPTAASCWRFDWRGVGEYADPEGGWLQGCCLLLRTNAIAEVGLFDEQFFLFYEDADLSRRIQHAGWSLAECPEARVVHVGHQTVLRRELATFTPVQGLRSRFLYISKHHGRWSALMISWVGRSLLTVRAARFWLRGLRSGCAHDRGQARLFMTLALFDPRQAVSLPERGF